MIRLGFYVERDGYFYNSMCGGYGMSEVRRIGGNRGAKASIDIGHGQWTLYNG